MRFPRGAWNQFNPNPEPNPYPGLIFAMNLAENPVQVLSIAHFSKTYHIESGTRDLRENTMQTAVDSIVLYCLQ